MEIFTLENWQNYWGATIILGLPSLFIIATFVYKKREPIGRGLVPPQIVRFLLVPSLMIHLILNKIVGYSSDDLVIKISVTVIALILISFLFNAMNYLFLSKNNILTHKEIVPKLGRSVIHIILMTIITACLLSKIWGLDLGNLLTALGVSSLVIGLALQEPLGNLFNGISLLMANPFKKGDWVRIGSEVGMVAEINWRSVKIHTSLNEQIIIPNNMLSKELIKNLSRPSRLHAVVLEFGFSYDDNPVKVKDVLLGIAHKNDKVLESPSPQAITLSYGDFAIVYGLKIFIKDYEDLITLKDDLMTSIYQVAKEQNLSIPFPQQEINIINH